MNASVVVLSNPTPFVLVNPEVSRIVTSPHYHWPGWASLLTPDVSAAAIPDESVQFCE